MAWPDSFVEEVRRAADIVRYISEHVPLRKAGSAWKGLCPFHQEKTPSFNVRADPPIFHCFGCGEGGDVFKFAMLYERLTFPEAVEKVARQFGVPVPERRVAPTAESRERHEILSALEDAAKYFEANLWQDAGRTARDYLLGRGFKRQTLETIRAGAALNDWGGLLQSIRRRHSEQTLLKAGLISPRRSGAGFYDRFRNRAVFPIMNEAGKVVAFGARSLDQSEPKYLNSPETPVYSKSEVLYGFHWARESARKGGAIVLMEGYLDVARALECDVPGAVATCGTALTAPHVRLLRRLGVKVVVNFDQDEAGQRAAARSVDVLIEQGIRAEVVELPPGHDPDSFMRSNGGDAYRERLNGATPLMEWLVGRAARQHPVNTPEGKRAFLDAVLPTLARIEDPVERIAWLPHLEDRGGIEEGATLDALRQALRERSRTLKQAPPKSSDALAGLLVTERLLIARMLRRSEGVVEALAEIEDSDLQGLRSAAVIRAAVKLSANRQEITVAALERELANDEERRLVREAAVAETPAREQSLHECVLEIRRHSLARRLRQIQRELPHADGPAVVALLQEKLDLKRRISQLDAGRDDA